MIQVNDPQPVQNYVTKTPRSKSKHFALLPFSFLNDPFCVNLYERGKKLDFFFSINLDFYV